MTRDSSPNVSKPSCPDAQRPIEDKRKSDSGNNGILISPVNQSEPLTAKQFSTPPVSTLPAWVLERAADQETRSPRREVDPLATSEDFLTVAEAAAVLRISERTLRRHLSNGKILHIRVGRQIRIPRRSLTVGW